MAVFTPVTLPDAQKFCRAYTALPPITGIIPIEQGTDNSNFILVAENKQKFVLTVFEGRVNPLDLPAIFEFTAHCHKLIPTPKPYENINGGIMGQLHGKPAAIVEFLNGASHLSPTVDDCAKMGRLLGQLHKSRAGQTGLRDNPLSLEEWQNIYDENKTKIEKFDANAAYDIQELLRKLTLSWPHDGQIPSGAIHADLFPDNVFFDGGEISGIIDFYFAAIDFYIYDSMVTVNAWCFDAGGRINQMAFQSFLNAYTNQRPLSQAEQNHLSIMGQAAALRIALTRLRDWDKSGDFTPRNPRPYLNIIRFYQDNALKDLM